MKISTILNERSGIIKAPKEAIDNVMSIVCTDFFSRAVVYLNELSDDYADLFPIYKNMIADYRKKYGNFKLHPNIASDEVTSGSTVIRMANVDPRYFNRNKDAKHRTYKLDVLVDMMDEAGNEFAATYTKKSAGQPAKIKVWLPNQKHLQVVFKSPEIIPVTIERIEGYVEHELMHAVQDMALKQHDDTEDSYEDGKLNDEKYFQSEIEFSPQILTAAKDFMLSIKEFRAFGIPLSPADIRKHLLRFINPQAPKTPGVDFPDSEFFHVLFNKDKTKWKKAIKSFYGLIQNDLKL